MIACPTLQFWWCHSASLAPFCRDRSTVLSSLHGHFTLPGSKLLNLQCLKLLTTLENVGELCDASISDFKPQRSLEPNRSPAETRPGTGILRTFARFCKFPNLLDSCSCRALPLSQDPADPRRARATELPSLVRCSAAFGLHSSCLPQKHSVANALSLTNSMSMKCQRRLSCCEACQPHLLPCSARGSFISQ